MDEPNEYEISAMNQAGDVAGQYIDTIGRTDMATYTSEEWRGFVAAVCGAYVKRLGWRRCCASAISRRHKPGRCAWPITRSH